MSSSKHEGLCICVPKRSSMHMPSRVYCLINFLPTDSFVRQMNQVLRSNLSFLSSRLRCVAHCESSIYATGYNHLLKIDIRSMLSMVTVFHKINFKVS